VPEKELAQAVTSPQLVRLGRFPCALSLRTQN
jgi:hypothetical protein